MKITELIKHLSQVLWMEGDLECEVADSPEGLVRPVKSVNLVYPHPFKVAETKIQIAGDSQ